jgi:hypothetical protein
MRSSQEERSSSSKIQKAIEDFDLQEYVESFFDDIKEAANGEELRLNCFAPQGCAGSDTDHKLYVNPSKKQWICFKCGYGTSQQRGTGSIIKFISDAEGIPALLVRHRLLSAVRPSPEDAFTDLIAGIFDPAPAKFPSVVVPVNLSKGFYSLGEATGQTSLGKSFMDYAIKRGLSLADCRIYDVRYCPLPFMKENYREWVGRLVFPVQDREGNIKSASGRLVYSKPIKNRPRWWHWEGTHIDQLLWPLGMYTAWHNEVVLTEGIFDALAINKLSAYHGLCTFGHKISAGQLTLLKNLGIDEVILAWDRDSKRPMYYAAKELEEYGIMVKYFPFTNSHWLVHDLGDLIQANYPNNLSFLEASTILQRELNSAIPSHDPNVISWLST